ncbi:MAG: FkbM family methyltransferase [Terracidiphilus sp.]|jgi:FkbM family methyltransferase
MEQLPASRGSKIMRHDAIRRNHIVRKLYSLLQPLVFAANSTISRLKRLIVGKTVDALLVNSKQGLFLIGPEDLGVGGSLIKDGAYGEDEIQRISSLTNERSNVLFVGSHIGTLAIPTSRKVKHVTAIEANPNTFRLLTWNILLNNCQNIHAIQVAASDQKGQLEFIMSKANSGGSKRMPHIKAYKYFYDKPDTVKVNADRLDLVIPEDYDLIVMDIEGSEYFALKGMERLLANATHLIIEFIPHHLKNVSAITVKEFVALIEPHFRTLNIPSKKLVLQRPQFLPALDEMYSLNESDDGVIFSKG